MLDLLWGRWDCIGAGRSSTWTLSKIGARLNIRRCGGVRTIWQTSASFKSRPSGEGSSSLFGFKKDDTGRVQTWGSAELCSLRCAPPSGEAPVPPRGQSSCADTGRLSARRRVSSLSGRDPKGHQKERIHGHETEGSIEWKLSTGYRANIGGKQP